MRIDFYIQNKKYISIIGMKTRKNKYNGGGVTFFDPNQKGLPTQSCKNYDLKLIKKLSKSVCNQFIQNIKKNKIKENYTVTKEQDDKYSPIYYSFELKKEIEKKNIKITSLDVHFVYNIRMTEMLGRLISTCTLIFQVNFEVKKPDDSVCDAFVNLLSKVDTKIYNDWIREGRDEKQKMEHLIIEQMKEAASAEKKAESSEKKLASTEKKLEFAALASVVESVERSQSANRSSNRSANRSAKQSANDETYIEGVYDPEEENPYMELPGPDDDEEPTNGGKKRRSKKTRRQKRKTYRKKY